jgi:hypothetical protein
LKRNYFILIGLILSSLSFYGIEAVDIVKQIDINNVYKTMKSESDMIITANGKKIVKNMYGYSKGNKNFFIEFTNPDDQGTKYLKKDGNLYVYSPDAEEIIPITGHMLKESIMGSDMSYEDTLENDTIESQYNSRIVEEIEFEGHNVWVLELIGKKKEVSYPKKKLWVDKTNFTVWKTELYALSGTLLKEERVIEVKKIGERFYPIIIEMKDLLRKNSSTVFKHKKLELDVKIPENVFSIKNLEK